MFENEADAQIYEQIWREEGHNVRVCGSEEDYNYPLYVIDETAIYLLRRFSRPSADDPSQTGELVYHKIVRGRFGTGPDESEHKFTGVVYQNGTFIPYDTLRPLSAEEAEQWERAISLNGEWF